MVASIATRSNLSPDLGLGLLLGPARTPNISYLLRKTHMKLCARTSLLAVLFLLPQFMIAADTYVAINNGVPSSKPALHFAFENANPAARLQGVEPLPGVLN